LLAVAEDANQADGIILEDRGAFRGEFATADDKTVQALGAFRAAREQEIF